MRRKNKIKGRRKLSKGQRFRKIMKCLCSGEQSQPDEMLLSFETLATKHYSANALSALAGGIEQRLDTGNIEEAELSLRESGCLNYEEARALLGRYEYQKGNIEAALHVFEGIDVASVTPKIKATLSKRGGPRRRHSQHTVPSPMSMAAVNLLMEAIYLKAKSMQSLGRYKDAAQSCAVILYLVESSLSAGFSENFGADCKLQEILVKAVELLPELWKLADSYREAVLSYRWALAHPWNLDSKTTAKIQKDFAIFLLYSGGEAIPPNLRWQMDSSYVPRSNIEEAILLLMILLKKINLKMIEWDPSILDHLSYALSISGGLRALANLVEEFLPRMINRKERYLILSLCYYGDGDEISALNLLKKILSRGTDPNCVPALLMASKICGERPIYCEEGVSYGRRAIDNLHSGCDQMEGVAHLLLGISLSEKCRSVETDYERARIQREVLKSLEIASRSTMMRDPKVVYRLCLENAEQRKLDAALHYANLLLKMDGGSNLQVWMLLSRILSARKQFVDAEIVINAALEQAGTWDHVKLLRTKAKLQTAQGLLKKATETYARIFALLQFQRKSFRSGKKLSKDDGDLHRILETEVWHDLAVIYINLSRWRDAETCLLKSEAILPYSASRFHTRGLLYEAKNLHSEALKVFGQALDVNPNYVPSIVSMAMIFRRMGNQSLPIVRSLLTEAVRLDRMNASAWYNLGLLCKDEGNTSTIEAANCFEAAALLEESAPVEPFR